MKKFRLLAVMVITVAMLCTVAFAADVAFDAIEYNGSDATVTVTVKTTRDLAIDAYSAFAIDYNADVFEYASASSCDAKAELKDYAGRFEWANPSGDTNAAAGSALVTLVFNVKDAAAVVGETIGTNADLTFASEFNIGGDILDMVADVTITGAAAKEDPTYTAVVDPKAAFEGADGVNYTGIWVGAYTVALKGNTANVVTVDFDAKHSYTVDTDAAGEGSIAFKIAVLGAPVDAVGTPVLDGVAAVVAAE